MSAIEIVALTAVGGLVVALVVQAVSNQRVVARLVRLAAQEPIEPIIRPDIPAPAPLVAPQAPKRRITVPLPGIPWKAPQYAHGPTGLSPKSPTHVEENHEPTR